MMKKSLVLFTVIAAALLLTGCLSPKINFRIEPNPIVVTFDDFALRNVTLHFRLSGIGSGMTAMPSSSSASVCSGVA